MLRVARGRELGVTIEQIARDFEVHPMTPTKWMRRVDPDYPVEVSRSWAEAAQVREFKRNRLLEQGNEVLRRAAAYLSQANLPGE